jgi:SAM-dependent methyltransferase
VIHDRLLDLAVRRTTPKSRARRTIYRWVDLVDGIGRRTTSSGYPPAALRFRVHGDLGLEGFLESGRQCSEDIQTSLAAVGRDLSSFDRALDFGCGCGRTLLSLAPDAKNSELFGTDIDEEAIAWCRASLEQATFSLNGERPPLDFPDRFFDLVYAVSVFTHLPESLQLAWLQELRRVTAPGGLVLLTVRGPSYADTLSPEKRVELGAHGFVFSPMPPHLQHLFPAWYQTATMTEDYIRRTWSVVFEIVRRIPRAVDGAQDMIILRRP